jgi:hypothetical protein
MTNHIRLLIERQEATVGNIMQRLLGAITIGVTITIGVRLAILRFGDDGDGLVA